MEHTKKVFIPSDNPNPNPRYKMPLLMTKIIGKKGNKLRTSLENLAEVSKSIRFPETYIMKFLGIELGSQSTTKKVKGETTYTTKGEFSSEEIRECLDKCIWKYVVCEVCELPETYLLIEKGLVMSKCNSCGAFFKVDNKHKLASFILKNPPKNLTELSKIKTDFEEDLPKKIVKNKKKGVGNDENAQELKALIKTGYAEDFKLGSDLLERTTEFMRNIFLETTKEGEKMKKKQKTVIHQNLKSLKIDKNLRDRYDYILFHAVFGPQFGTKVEERAPFLKKLLKKGKREDQFHVSLIPIVQDMVFRLYKEKGIQKLVPTLMMKYYQAGLISRESLIEWKNNGEESDLRKEMKTHFMFEEKNLEAFKHLCKDFLEWLEAEGSSDSSSDSDSSED